MKEISEIIYKNENKEELLPGLTPEFPYIASCGKVDKYAGGIAPWHWHNEVEIFYVEQGVLEYYTPSGKTVFPAGSGGLVNSNSLHMTKSPKGIKNTTIVLHIFDTVLIGGGRGSRIEQNYIAPLVEASQVEIIRIMPGEPDQAKLLELLVQSFQIKEEEDFYEIRLRAALSEIWCGFLRIAEPQWSVKCAPNKMNEKIKRMLVYIHENYGEKITVSDIAEAAYISQRECFRAFHNGLGISPLDYLNHYRLQKACHMLAESNASVTEICGSCGLGSSSYFGKVFRLQMGCTPLEYRRAQQGKMAGL